MKKQLISLSIVMAMVLFTGCDSDDTKEEDNIVNEDLYDGEYDAIAIYKDVSSDYINYLETAENNYDYYKVYEVNDDTDCNDFGFSSSNSYYSRDGDGIGGIIDTYIQNGGYCYEYIFSISNDNYGSEDVILVYNY